MWTNSGTKNIPFKACSKNTKKNVCHRLVTLKLRHFLNSEFLKLFSVSNFNLILLIFRLIYLVLMISGFGQLWVVVLSTVIVLKIASFPSTFSNSYFKNQAIFSTIIND